MNLKRKYQYIISILDKIYTFFRHLKYSLFNTFLFFKFLFVVIILLFIAVQHAVFIRIE